MPSGNVQMLIVHLLRELSTAGFEAQTESGYVGGAGNIYERTAFTDLIRWGLYGTLGTS